MAAVLVSSLGMGEASARSTEPSMTITGAYGGVSLAAPGPVLNEGLPFTLSFTVTNTGGGVLTDLALEDGSLGTIDCPVTSLAPGESTVCERSTEAVRGRYRSSTVATAVAPDGEVVTESFRVGYHGKKTAWKPGIGFDLVFSGGSLRWPGPTLATGDPMDFTYQIHNSGTVPLRKLKVIPPPGYEVTCPTTTVDPGQSVDCVATGSIVDGRYKGKTIVLAWDARGAKVKASRLMHYVGEEQIVAATFAVDVLANGRSANEPPGARVSARKPVQWSIVVSNDGEDHLWGLYAWDGDFGVLACDSAHIAPGESAICKVKAEASKGPMSGEIEVAAWASDGRQITSRVGRHAFGIQAEPGLLIETYVDGFDADAHAGPRRVVGETLELTYVVSNIGSTTMRNVRVKDKLFGEIPCPVRRLASGAQMTCTHTTTAVLGWWETTGRAQGRSSDVKYVDSDKTFWHVRTVARISAIELDVSIGGFATNGGPGPAFAEGVEVEVVYVATNVGNSPLWSLEIRDPEVPFSEMTCSGTDDPDPGASLVCRATIVVQAGTHWEEIEAVAWNSDGTRILGTDTLRYSGVGDAT